MPPGSGLQARPQAPHSPADCGLPAAARPTGRGSKVYVTATVTDVNRSVTQIIAFSRMRCSVKRCTADPGSLQAPEFGTIPGLQRTADALRCAREILVGHGRA